MLNNRFRRKCFLIDLFCFYKLACTCFIRPYRIRKAKSIPGNFLSTVCRSKQTLWDRGWKKEFVQADLFVQKAGNKIVIYIALVLSIFRNSFKVPLINMTLIAKVRRKRAWLSGDSLSNIKIATFNLSNSVRSKTLS